MNFRNLVDRIKSGSADPQAVLFYGADENQLKLLAQELASYWTGVEPEKLGRCVDYQEIRPTGSGKQIIVGMIQRDNKAEKEETKWIPVIEFFRTLPLIAKKKVVWFVDAERMNSAAANAFLKTLEELAPHSRVVLTTTQFSRILPTIRSRCICVSCGFNEWDDNGPKNEMEQAFATHYGELELVRRNSLVLDEVWRDLNRLSEVPISAAVYLSERTVKHAGELAKAEGIGTREAQVFLLELIGRWWLRKFPEFPTISSECNVISREILGYSNGQLGFDTLFGMMLAYLREQNLVEQR